MCKICYFESSASDSDSPEQVAYCQMMRCVIEDASTYGETGTRDKSFEFDSVRLGGHVYMAQFETRKMSNFLELV